MKAYTSVQAKARKEKIKLELFEDSIKALEVNNKKLAKADKCKDEEIKMQVLQYEHCQRLLNNYQHQLDECWSSLKGAMTCYEIEFKSHQITKNLLQVSINTLL